MEQLDRDFSSRSLGHHAIHNSAANERVVGVRPVDASSIHRKDASYFATSFSLVTPRPERSTMVSVFKRPEAYGLEYPTTEKE